MQYKTIFIPCLHFESLVDARDLHKSTLGIPQHINL